MIRLVLRTAALVAVLLAHAAVMAEPGVHWKLRDAGTLAEHLPLNGPAFDPADYADVPLVHATIRSETLFGRDAVTERVVWVDYFGTVDGVQQYSNDRIPWEADAETVTVHRAAVVTASGAVRRFDPADARIADTDTYDVFTDQREVLLSLPGVEQGAWSVIEFERVTPREERHVPWQRVGYLQGPVPIHSYEHVVRWEPGVTPPTWAQRGDVLECENVERGIRCRNPAPIPTMLLDDEVNYYDNIPQFAVGEATSWSRIVELMQRGILAATMDTDEIDRVFRRLAGERRTAKPSSRDCTSSWHARFAISPCPRVATTTFLTP